MNSEKRSVKIPEQPADIDDLATWVKYSPKLCDHCRGTCCSLPVEVKTSDLVRMGLISEFDLQENPKVIFKRLRKEKLVQHYHARTETLTLAQLANGDCIYLDQATRRCTIYDKRPETCRRHPVQGPRPGYCAFVPG
jgi:Fe-S-cluster containining protein